MVLTTILTTSVNFVIARRLTVPWIVTLGLMGPVTTMVVTAQGGGGEEGLGIIARVVHAAAPFVVLNLTSFLPSWLGLVIGHVRSSVAKS